MRHRLRLAAILVACTIFLLAGRGHSQIQFNPNLNLNLNLYDSPAAAPCKAAIAAKIHTEHDALAHFEAQPTVERDTAGNTRVRGLGWYLLVTASRSFTFDCVYDEHNKAITSASYEDYAVNSERLVPPQSQAQDCQEQTIAKVYASEGYSQRVFTIPQSIVSKTKKNGDRVIYGDGSLETGPFRFNCTYKDGRLDKFDYYKETGPLYGGAVRPPPHH
jgi:hypothetical protein